ncbi:MULTISPECIES: hypothetical protein [unclassified Streptosporangium]|uniref:hypothetical protein n=1 Tax=unclassified Streptosporangium TaxID=2632669 RepID=UPI002E2D725D|nr:MULTISPECIES: hypothetical protein [unclassified Streptosporangium]
MTYQTDDSEPAERVMIPARPVDRPAPAVSEEAARSAAGQGDAPVGLIAVITGCTTSWQLLGPWPTAGIAL